MTTLILSFLIGFGSACTSPNEVASVDFSDIVIVEKVSVSGREGIYTFSVTLKSPDKGCNQYANWWEVLSEDGTLIYRRILGHSHVNEQPFTRSGGTINISATDVVIIRGHMNNAGYSESSMKGTVKDGFVPFEILNTFASDLENVEPLPTSCAF